MKCGSSQKKVFGLAFQRNTGYAWVVLIASYIPQMVSMGFPYSVAILQQAWTEVFRPQHSMAAISSVGSMNLATMFCAGPLASFTIHHLGHRITVVLGTILSIIGYVIG